MKYVTRRETTERTTTAASSWDTVLTLLHYGEYLKRRDDAIRAAHADGVSLRRIARTVGLSPAQVCRIFNGTRNATGAQVIDRKPW